MKQKILITGASGLLGNYLTLHLRRSFEIITHSLKSKTEYNGDLADFDFVKSMLEESVPDIIINLVALTNVDECELNPKSAYDLNTLTVLNLVRSLQVKDQCLLIHISTDQLYDGNGKSSESDIKPSNYYSYSKFLGEVYASQYKKHVILRTNFFGPCNGLTKKSFSDWIIDSCKNQIPITLFSDVLFSPLHMHSIIDALGKVISNPFFGTFNLGSHLGFSKREFGLKLAAHLNLNFDNVTEGNVGDFNLKAYRPRDMRMDLTRFEKTYQYKLPTLEEEIKKIGVQNDSNHL